MMTGEKRLTTEDVLGDFGFRLCWAVEDHWADVKAFEITGYENGAPLFGRLDARSSADTTGDVSEAEAYLEGFVKWDGCSEFGLGHVHWCGPDAYKKHFRLLEYVYRRAFELMGRHPEEDWD